MELSALASRVRKGAAMLDKRRPGWAIKIDTDILDIASCDACVLAQLDNRSYLAARARLRISMRKAITLGLHPESADDALDECTDLTTLWKQEINDRVGDRTMVRAA